MTSYNCLPFIFPWIFFLCSFFLNKSFRTKPKECSHSRCSRHIWKEILFLFSLSSLAPFYHSLLPGRQRTWTQYHSSSRWTFEPTVFERVWKLGNMSAPITACQGCVLSLRAYSFTALCCCDLPMDPMQYHCRSVSRRQACPPLTPAKPGQNSLFWGSLTVRDSVRGTNVFPSLYANLRPFGELR